MAEEHIGIEGNLTVLQDQAVQNHSCSMDMSKAPLDDTKNMHSSKFSLQMSLNGNLLEPRNTTLYPVLIFLPKQLLLVTTGNCTIWSDPTEPFSES